jgi:hypothetical protein
VNVTISPRIAYGLTPFSQLRYYAENVPEVAMCLRLLTEEIKAFIPEIQDEQGKMIHDPELEWLTERPDRFNPWPTWLSRFLYNVLVYDAGTIYKVRGQSQTLQKGVKDHILTLDSKTGLISWRCPVCKHHNDKVSMACEQCGAEVPLSVLEKFSGGLDTWQCRHCQCENPLSYRHCPPCGMPPMAKSNNFEVEAPVISLRNVDGSTMFVLIDERGEQPTPPAPSFQQIIYGVPKIFLNAYQIWYRPRHLRADAPYGRSPIEDAMPAVVMLQNLWQFEGQKYISGNMPEAIYTAPEGWSTEQIFKWEDDKTARLAQNFEERARFEVWPFGFSQVGTKDITFNETSYAAATNAVRMAGYAEAMESSLYRMGLAPLIEYIQSLFDDILVENGYPEYHFKLTFPTETLDPEKEEARWSNRLQIGGVRLDEYREGIKLKPLGGEEGETIYRPGIPGGDEGGGLGSLGDLLGGSSPGGNGKIPVVGGGHPIPVNTKVPVAHNIPAVHNIPVRDLANIKKMLSDEESLRKHCGTCPEDDTYLGATVEAPQADVFMPHQGANDSQVVVIGGRDLDRIPAVFKPASGEKASLREWVGGSLYPRDEANYLLDRMLAPDENRYMVPVSYQGKLNNEAGSVQMYVKGRGGRQNVSEYDPHFVEQAAVLDYIAGQVDRVRNNWLTHPDDDNRPILIDNHLSFPDHDEQIRSSFIVAWGDQPLDSEMLHSIYGLLHNKGFWQDIAECVGKQASQAALDRAETLYDAERIPSDGVLRTEHVITGQRSGEGHTGTSVPGTMTNDPDRQVSVSKLAKAEFDEGRELAPKNES